jgi:hypothetical protein
MNDKDVREWFGRYLDAFAACVKGERDTASLLAFYGVPIVFTTDDGCFALTLEEHVIGAVQPQIDALRAAHYARSEIVESNVTVVNAHSAIVDCAISRQRADGTEISRLGATYIVTDGARGRRISLLAVKSAR